MTAAEIQVELEYRRQERLGILLDGRRDPTPVELVLARHEASSFIQDLERQDLIERMVVTSRTAQRDRELKRRFGK